jgi:hypothetical protein
MFSMSYSHCEFSREDRKQLTFSSENFNGFFRLFEYLLEGDSVVQDILLRFMLRTHLEIRVQKKIDICRRIHEISQR